MTTWRDVARAGLIALGLLVCAAAGWAAPAHAASQGGGATVSLAPLGSAGRSGYFIFHGRRGRTIHGTVAVSNVSRTGSGRIRLYAVDAATGQTTGAVYLSAGQPRRDVGRWIRLSTRSVTLGPRRRTLVHFTVRVPRRTRGGQHLGAIVATPAVPLHRYRGRRHGHRFQIKVQALTVLAVQVNLPGRSVQRMAIGGCRMGGQHRYQTMFVGLRNSGDVLLKGVGHVSVARVGGARVKRQSFPLDTFVPRTRIAYSARAPRPAAGSRPLPRDGLAAVWAPARPPPRRAPSPASHDHLHGDPQVDQAGVRIGRRRAAGPGQFRRERPEHLAARRRRRGGVRDRAAVPAPPATRVVSGPVAALLRSRLGAAVLAAAVAVTAWSLLSAAPARAAIAFVASRSAVSPSTMGLTIPKPLLPAAGQVLVATVVINSTGAISPPPGWTPIADTVTSIHAVTYYHVAVAADPGSWTWSFGSATAASGGIVSYSGVNTRVPIDAAAASSGTASKSAVAPSMTTNSAGDQVIAAVSFGSAKANAVTQASGTTERYDTNGLLGTGTATESEAADFTQATAGATGSKIATAAISAPWIAQTIALNAGAAAGLSVSTSAAPSFSANLPAGDQTPTYTLPLTVQNTSSTSGWNLTITSTPFTSGGHTLATTASRVTAVPAPASCLGGGTCTLPTNSVSYPVTVPAGPGPPAAAKFFNAAANTGLGTFSLTPTISVAVPANSYAGTYKSTVTISMISGP
jgi:hypothetical protein